jgi:hypothetical protein
VEIMSRVAGVILAACCAAAVACGTAAPVSAASRPAATRPVAFDCKGRHDGKVQPGTVYLDCLSGNAFVRTPSWVYWSGVAAKTSQPGQPRTAVLWVNTCTPICAAGHYRKYKAVLSFFRPETVHGVRFFTRMRLRYFHNRARDYTYRWGTFPGATLPGWIGGPGGG